MESILSKFGFTDYEVMLSTRPEKSVGTDEIWDAATEVCFFVRFRFWGECLLSNVLPNILMGFGGAFGRVCAQSPPAAADILIETYTNTRTRTHRP